jgi:hypothetical protein
LLDIRFHMRLDALSKLFPASLRALKPLAARPKAVAGSNPASGLSEAFCCQMKQGRDARCRQRSVANWHRPKYAGMFRKHDAAYMLPRSRAVARVGVVVNYIRRLSGQVCWVAGRSLSMRSISDFVRSDVWVSLLRAQELRLVTTM